MNNVKYFLGNILMIVFIGCNTQINREEIDNVSLIQVDTGSCQKTYHIRFDDPDENSRMDSFYYWAGLKKNNDDGATIIVARSDSVIMTPPFSNTTLTVNLSSANVVIPGEKLLAVAVKNFTASEVGDWTRGYQRTQSKDMIDAPSFEPSCCPIDIQLTANGITMSNAIDTTSSNKIVYIDEVLPSMPSLSAVIGNSQVTGLVDWTLTIKYTRNGRYDIETYNYNSVPATNGWLINSAMGAQIRGGQAVLTCRSQALNCIEFFTFCIRARNPAVPTVENYIDNSLGAIWYAKYVAKKEGGVQNSRRYLQFNEIGSLACTSSDVKYTPNAAGIGDGGFGMYQLTNIFGRPPNEQELWDWKENVVAGVSWLGVKQNGANSYMANERPKAFDSINVQFINPRDTTLSSITYADGTSKTLEHAIAMKRYNGLGLPPLRDFTYWDANLNQWMFSPWATYIRVDNGNLDSNAYVSDVSALYP